MSGFQVTVPLQFLCRLMVAAQVGENMTLPSTLNSPFAETKDLRVLPSGYVAFPDFGVAYKMSTVKLTYNGARKICLEENGQLAVIDSREKIEKIREHFGNSHSFWIGLGRFHDTQEWITIDGKSTKNLPWANGEPSGNNRCGYSSIIKNGLRSGDCQIEDKYMCEIALPRN